MNGIYIDTSSNKRVLVSLTIEGKEFTKEQVKGQRKAQIVLPLIEKLLKEHSLNLENIEKLEVNEGPGSFTGLRVGITIANTLSYLLKIPINKRPIGTIVVPKYE